MADQSRAVKDGSLIMLILWTIIGLVCGLLIALPTTRFDTTCINLQTGLIINCIAALIGMMGMQWLAMPLLLIGVSVVVYALMTCASPFNSGVRR